MELMRAGQCFPLYYYDKIEKTKIDLLDEYPNEDGYVKKDSISDYILQKARIHYNQGNITKEVIFYYVYGFLHCPEYRKTYANDLKKSLPRIPLVENKDDFWSFSKIGRKLADLHLNYESITPHPDVIVNKQRRIKLNEIKAEQENAFNFYGVTKLSFQNDKSLKTKQNKQGLDKSTIFYNGNITIKNIPLKAYDYVINGKSAIEWVIDRYQVKTDTKSGITNNPNDWSKEVGNPRYILDLLLSVINLSIKTLDLVEELPKVKFES